MTREELLKMLTYIVSKCDNVINNKNYTADDFVQDNIEDIGEVCNMVLDGKYGDILEPQPSLPADIDEAAEKNFENMEVLEHENIFDETHNRIFKAGAEWMAGQGVKIGETEIYLEDNGDEPPYTQEWLDLDSTEFRIPDGAFKPGDKVEVILRKK